MEKVKFKFDVKDDREYISDIYTSNEYFCIDFETTSLNPEEGDILEVYFKHVKDNKIVLEKHGLFFSEDWIKTFHIHEIPFREIQNKNKFIDDTEFKELMKHYINRCMDKNDKLVFMAQYAPFEIKWIQDKLYPYNSIQSIKVYDTRYVEKLLYPNLNCSLIPICKRRNIKPKNGKNFHRAKMDVDAMYEVYKQQILEIKNLKNIIKL